jgi:hypothetical protein
MVIEFLYNLDYDTNNADPAHTTAPLTNGVNGHHDTTAPEEDLKVNGHAAAEEKRDSIVVNGSNNEVPTQAPEQPPAEPLDDFLPGTNKTLSASAKKKARQRRRKSIVAEQRAALDAPTSPPPVQVNGNGEVHNLTKAMEDAQLQDEELPPGTALSPEPHSQPDLQRGTQGQGSLTIHAKVYTLSKKYVIPTLQSLSLSKFASEAAQEWDSEDFLRAAREVYSTPLTPSSSAGKGSAPLDRSLRDVVSGIVFEHPELLDENSADAFKGLDLAMDVLMQVKRHGWSKGGGEDVERGRQREGEWPLRG